MRSITQHIPTNSLISTPSYNLPKKKRRLLCWSDAVIVTTGFGVVSKHILGALYRTGLYEIDQLAINFFGDFYDHEAVPYCIVPAKLGNPKDPYGNQMLVDSLKKKDYDILFVINDTFVVEEVAKHIPALQQQKLQQKKSPFKVVYYYPIDCCLLPNFSSLIKLADRSVAYTNFAREETLKIEGVKPTDVIYHGADIEVFRPLDPKLKIQFRKDYLGITDSDKFLWINVNRNSLRKDIAKTIMAFTEFRKTVPNSALYLHTMPKDGSHNGHIIDLMVIVRECGLVLNKDIFFPQGYHAAKGFPPEVLNRLYNCADAYISTHLGEGFGLTGVEAMAAGVPCVVPNNTSTPELFGKEAERGYIYPCKERIYIDNSGSRLTGHMEDIVATMLNCYQDWRDCRDNKGIILTSKIKNARAFAEQYSWNNVCQSWIKLFEEVASSDFIVPPKQVQGDRL